MKKILFVDDEKNIRDLYSLYFKNKYETEFAVDGNDALNKLKSSKIDLIVLDLMMPNLDGFNFAKVVRRDPDYYFIPIIAVTAKVDHKSMREAKKSGINMFLTKPLELEELEEHIEYYLNKG